MRRIRSRTITAAVVAALALVLGPPAAAAKLRKFEFTPIKAGVGPLFPASSETIKVIVNDRRREPEVLYCTLIGIQGVFMGVTPEKPESVAAAMLEDAREAVEVLGFKNGDGGYTLEITVQDIRIDIPVSKGVFGALNFISYASVDTVLKGPDGAQLASKSFRMASWISMAAGKIPLAYKYARYMWEAVARTLLPQFPKDPDPAAVKTVIGKYDLIKEDAERTNLLTWLGLLGKPAPGVVEKLQQVFRTEEDQTLYETAAISLARYATPEIQEELMDVASRKKVLKEWDPGDAEEGWTLTYALHLMQVPDLKAKAPKLTRDPERQVELYTFLETGEPPKRPEKLERKLAEAKSKLKG